MKPNLSGSPHTHHADWHSLLRGNSRVGFVLLYYTCAQLLQKLQGSRMQPGLYHCDLSITKLQKSLSRTKLLLLFPG